MIVFSVFCIYLYQRRIAWVMFCEKFKRDYYAETDLTFLVNISNSIAHSKDIYKDLELIAKKICEYLRAQYCIFTLMNHSYCLSPTLQTGFSSGTIDKGTLNNVLEKVEKQMIIDTLILIKGHISKAASRLGITERIMGLRISKYEIVSQRYKQLSNE